MGTLSEKEILQDASQLVTELVADLAQQGLDDQQMAEALQSAMQTFGTAAQVIKLMFDGNKNTTYH